MALRWLLDTNVISEWVKPAPDAAVLFAWNYHDEIVPKLRERGFSGEIILP